jgi:hypothetical protein
MPLWTLAVLPPLERAVAFYEAQAERMLTS